MTSRQISYLFAVLGLLPVNVSAAQRSEGFRTLARLNEDFVSGPRPSPDGRLLLFGTRTDMRVYDVASRRATKVVDGQGWELAWSPKGDRIAWVRGDDEGAGEYIWTMPVDPRTGTPSGPAQRVSLGQGEFPAISLDGRWIAYSAPDTDGPGSTNGLLPHHIAVVSVTGGPARAIGHFSGGTGSAYWSADGKSIYVQATPPNGKLGVLKVPVDGRPMQVLHTGADFVAGMTANRQRIVLVPTKGVVAPGDRALVIDTTGREVGRVALPVGKLMSYEGILGDSALVWIGVDDRQRIEIRSLVGGATKRLPVVGQSNDRPAWSPDGKHIVFHVLYGEQRALAVADADGAHVRTLRDIGLDPDPTLGAARWSPDSRYVGFTHADQHQLSILDVSTRRTQTVLRDTTVRIGAWTWRAEGKSIVAVMIKSLAPPRGTIDEVMMTHARRTLFDFGTLGLQPTSGFGGFTFLGDSAVSYRADTASYILKFGDSAPRRATAIPRATVVIPSGASADHRLVAGPFHDMKHHEGDQLEVLSIVNGQRRVLDVPFRLAGGSPPAFLPDNSAMLVFGRREGDTSPAVLYAVPVNGDLPRAIATVGQIAGSAMMSLSPDGKSVAYPVRESHTLELLLVDLRGR